MKRNYVCLLSEKGATEFGQKAGQRPSSKKIGRDKRLRRVARMHWRPWKNIQYAVEQANN